MSGGGFFNGNNGIFQLILILIILSIFFDD